jgi:nitroreductase
LEVFEAIRGRRSVRAFRDRNVTEEIVDQLIDAAHWAPSAGNIQPWEFIIVRKPDIKKRLAKAALEQTSIIDAPVVIVVCADENRSMQRYGDRGKTLFCLQDTAAAVQNILLTAHSLGLGSCWIGAFTEEEAEEILQLPQHTRPVAIIPVGYPAENPLPRNRRPANQITHFETF